MPKLATAIPAFCLAALIAPFPAAYAADITVDRLELVTHGGMNPTTGSFDDATTLLNFDLSIKGGDKFVGLLRMDFLNTNLENAMGVNSTSAASSPATDSSSALTKLNALTNPNLKTAAVTARDAFDLPVDATYFVGYMDGFATGDDFVQLYGAAPFGTALRGPMVYPNGINNNPTLQYDGIAAANGTGFRLNTTPRLFSSLTTYLYLYQDSDIGHGQWSGDLRTLLNSEKIKFELFTGASTSGTLGVYRAGLLFYAAPGDVGEFFAQIGVPHWDPSGSFSINDLFFLFEPRINFGIALLSLTVFYHPAFYRDQPTNENGALDTDFNLRFGNLNRNGAQGGLDGLLEFRPLTATTLNILISPYYAAISGGVEWDFKLGLQVYPAPPLWYGIFQPFIGLKTSF